MEWDDEGLEDEPASPLLPPDDRLWRHPSEVAGAPAAAGAVPTAVRGTAGIAASSTRVVTVAALTSCISVLLTIGVVAALRPFPSGSGGAGGDGPEPGTDTIAAKVATPDVAGVAARLRPAITQVVARKASGASAWGSGVLVRADGLILTSHDLVEGADRVRVVLDDGRDLLARVVGSDPETGVAVLDIDGEGYPTAPMADDSTTVAVGDPAITIGSSRGTTATEPLVRVSMVSAMHQDAGADGHRLVDVIRTDAAIQPGCAGGAVVDAGGRVVGIAVANVDTAGGPIGLAAPISVAWSVADGLERNGRVVRAWLGVDGETHEDGALVRAVTAASPAAAAGLQPGDVIVAVDGERMASMSAVIVQVRSHRPGDVVTVSVQRGAARLDVPVTLAEKPQPS